MPVAEADLKIYNSIYTPLNDTDVNGGAINTASEITGTVDEVFHDMRSEESGEPDFLQYRKIFYRNTSAANLLNAKIWLSPNPHAHVNIALEGTKGGNDTSTNRVTAPGGYSFVLAPDEDNAIAVPGTHLNAGENIGIWMRMTIPAGESPRDEVTTRVRIVGDSTE